MRLARIASPDAVAFVSIEGDPGQEIAREIAEHPFGTPTFTGRSGRSGNSAWKNMEAFCFFPGAMS